MFTFLSLSGNKALRRANKQSRSQQCRRSNLILMQQYSRRTPGGALKSLHPLPRFVACSSAAAAAICVRPCHVVLHSLGKAHAGGSRFAQPGAPLLLRTPAAFARTLRFAALSAPACLRLRHGTRQGEVPCNAGNAPCQFQLPAGRPFFPGTPSFCPAAPTPTASGLQGGSSARRGAVIILTPPCRPRGKTG